MTHRDADNRVIKHFKLAIVNMILKKESWRISAENCNLKKKKIKWTFQK